MHHLLLTLVGIALSGAMLIGSYSYLSAPAVTEVAREKIALAALARMSDDVVVYMTEHYDGWYIPDTALTTTALSESPLLRLPAAEVLPGMEWSISFGYPDGQRSVLVCAYVPADATRPSYATAVFARVQSSAMAANVHLTDVCGSDVALPAASATALVLWVRVDPVEYVLRQDSLHPSIMRNESLIHNCGADAVEGDTCTISGEQVVFLGTESDGSRLYLQAEDETLYSDYAYHVGPDGPPGRLIPGFYRFIPNSFGHAVGTDNVFAYLDSLSFIGDPHDGEAVTSFFVRHFPLQNVTPFRACWDKPGGVWFVPSYFQLQPLASGKEGVLLNPAGTRDRTSELDILADAEPLSIYDITPAIAADIDARLPRGRRVLLLNLNTQNGGLRSYLATYWPLIHHISYAPKGFSVYSYSAVDLGGALYWPTYPEAPFGNKSAYLRSVDYRLRCMTRLRD
jgi:hypothetical protein